MTDDLRGVIFLAEIGRVCASWAALETTALAIVGIIQKIPVDECAIAFGSLNLQNRFNVAINLAIHHEAPGPIISDLKALRAALQKGDPDLADRRNQVVHGAHKEAHEAGSSTMTMYSWKISKREQVVSVEDLQQLADDIMALQARAEATMNAVAAWRFGDRHRQVDGTDDLGRARPVSRVKLGERINARVQHLWRNLFG